jgi:hypothetical protein
MTNWIDVADRIEELGVQFPDPNFTPEIPCSLASEELVGGEF